MLMISAVSPWWLFLGSWREWVSESPDDDTGDNATAADIPVQDAAAAVAGRGWERAGRAAGHVAGCVAGCVAGRAAAKSISLTLIII